MNSKLDLNRIHYFVSVVECASYTKAAERLGVPKSTLSRNVQALEEDINLRLLNRSTRKLSLTKAGEQYYQNCLPLINDLQKAQAQILDYQ
ncbi:MAG: LysR family transcriptional regulator, partial [Pseudomonadota bacterium]|nr:LysR family transcriptional regulator [Pseudomonadota bacterium]